MKRRHIGTKVQKNVTRSKHFIYCVLTNKHNIFRISNSNILSNEDKILITKLFVIDKVSL